MKALYFVMGMALGMSGVMAMVRPDARTQAKAPAGSRAVAVRTVATN